MHMNDMNRIKLFRKQDDISLLFNDNCSKIMHSLQKNSLTGRLKVR